MAFIFSTSSYVVSYQLNDEEVQEAKAYCKSHGIRFLVEEEFDSLNSNLEKISYLVAILSNQDLSKLDDTHPGISQKVVSVESSVTDVIDRILQGMPSDHLPGLMIESACEISKSFFPLSECQFDQVSRDSFNFTHVIRCETECSDHKGRCEFFINGDKLNSLFPEVTPQDPEKLKDALREFTNQFIGLINRSAEDSGNSTKIGIPQAFSFEDYESFPKSSLYIPVSTVQDSQEIFRITLGYVHPNKGPEIDFSSIRFTTGEEDIDFF